LIFQLHGRCHASELFVAIFGGVVAMKKGGKKYIIYMVSNSYVSSSFYLKVVCKHKCTGPYPTLRFGGACGLGVGAF